MGTFTYYNDIPAANNNPSSDQPKMTNNTNVIDQILDVDHYSFESASLSDGQHKQVNFTLTTLQGAQTDPASVIHTATGTVTTKSECYFKNQNASFLMSGVRAFGSFLGVPAGTVVGTAVTPTTQSNVSTIVNASFSSTTNRRYVVNLTSGSTISNDAVVMVFLNNIAFMPTYTLVANVLTITCNLSGLGIAPNMDGTIVNFVILQV